jgi:radical SAM superfamily enzyme YgiQ (UPF0313 family)
MKEYCRMAKSIDPRIITVCGGVHIELFPEDIDDENVDYRVVRNATRVFPLLIGYLAKQNEYPAGVLRYKELLLAANLPEFDFFFPIPDRSFTRHYRDRYFYVFIRKVALMKTSFGCPFHCTFCYCRQITGERYAERPMDDVIRELQGIPQKEIYIVDDDFLCSPARVREFLDKLKEYDIRKKYLVYGRADFIVQHEDLIREFREAGLRAIIVGLESFFDDELDGFKKQTSGSLNEKAMQILNRYKVDCYAAVILSPGWGKEEFAFVAQELRKLKVRFVNLQPLTPLKGIEMLTEESRLIISRDDFARWDLAHVSIRPEKLGITEYYNEIVKLYNTVLFRPSYLIHHLKYPLIMHWKMMKGLLKVWRQYQRFVINASPHA